MFKTHRQTQTQARGVHESAAVLFLASGYRVAISAFQSLFEIPYITSWQSSKRYLLYTDGPNADTVPTGLLAGLLYSNRIPLTNTQWRSLQRFIKTLLFVLNMLQIGVITLNKSMRLGGSWTTASTQSNGWNQQWLPHFLQCPVPYAVSGQAMLCKYHHK